MSDAALEELEPVLERQPLPTNVMKNVLSGTSALGAGVVLERSLGFLSNILAARFGGASTFGAYSLAISTANNVSTYAAGGIGSTAIRFSGEYSRGTPGYATLAKVLALIAMVSCGVAGIILFFGADPLARLLAKPSIVPVLRWAAFSASGILLLECARGFFVGQRRLKAVILLSAVAGLGMVTVLPAASHFGPIPMIFGQSAVAVGAVLVCLALYKPLELRPPAPVERAEPFVPLLKKVWSYAVMQVGGLVGLNAAGWWLTSLVAKGDTSMVQMGFFAVAHQFRNVVALVPSLLIEGSFAEMAKQNSEIESTPNNVMALCCYASTLICLVVAGAGIVVVPWMLTLIYGKAYTAAASATAIALATSLAHMSTGAAWQRLSVISIKAAAVVNTIWAIYVAAVATTFLLHASTAAKGAAVYLTAHVLQAIIIVAVLKRKGNMPAGLPRVLAWGLGSIVWLAILSVARDFSPDHQVLLTAVCVLSWISSSLVLIYMGKRLHWLPSRSMVERLVARLPLPLKFRKA